MGNKATWNQLIAGVEKKLRKNFKNQTCFTNYRYIFQNLFTQFRVGKPF